MKTLQKTLLIIVSFMIYTSTTYAMKLPSKMGKSVKNIGNRLLGKQSNQPFNFPSLPEEIQAYIVELMTQYSKASSIKSASKALRNLSQTSTTLYKLINNAQFNEQLLFYLAQRFECSMDDAAYYLATPAAQKYLNKSLAHLITSDNPIDIQGFLVLSTNINAPLDDQENTALMIAIHHLAFNSIIILLNNKKLNLTATNENGDNILHVAFYKLFLLKAQGDQDNYAALKKVVIRIVKKCKEQKQINTLLYASNQAGDRPSIMADMLDDNDFFIQFFDASGETV